MTCLVPPYLSSTFLAWGKHLTAGITISGGQKARLSIARAVYARCGVVLMDDPLSALDNIVGSWVFKNALLEMAQRAAVVMSTHQSQVGIIQRLLSSLPVLARWPGPQVPTSIFSP